MAMKKKLIEVALPLEAINQESAREKSIRRGHPSTLHLWWARRPLATARAVIWASLVDDPSSHPELFPDEESQRKERERLFGILTRLVKWENSNDEGILTEARAEILRSTNGNPPAFLDPFAGGGAIPLEAQRLGLKAYAHDLNPVAVTINKAMIEIPAKFIGNPPVNPEKQRTLGGKSHWKGATGLAEDIAYYGNWINEEAKKRIGHLYPCAKLQDGREAPVIAWIWARTVKCPNPACGCEMPLVRSFTLTKKKGSEAYVEPLFQNGEFSYSVKYGKHSEWGTVNRSGAQCAACGASVPFDYVRGEGRNGRISQQMMAVVAEGAKGRVYLTPDAYHKSLAEMDEPIDIPDTYLPEKALSFRVQVYGMVKHKQLFTNRQLTALKTFADLVSEAQSIAEHDAEKAGMHNDHIALSEGGIGAHAYGEAIGVYLAFSVSKLTNRASNLCPWKTGVQCPGDVFGRQAIPMVWDYAESNVFGSSGSFSSMYTNVVAGLLSTDYSNVIAGEAKQFDAQSDAGFKDIMVSTDPPYYDNIGYADLSDYFYVWLRQVLKNTYPKVFKTMLVPKAEELVATPYRFDGSFEKAKEFFEDGMYLACQQFFKYSRDDIPVTIYYAFKQSESEATDDDETQVASSGWETMLSAIIRAGFAITGTWPVRTERENRNLAHGTNALASSIVLVCRKRGDNSRSVTRREFINALHREMRPALEKLQSANIAPVDLAQSAIGPGIGVFSRYKSVLEADGTPMSVRAALQIINQELDAFYNEQEGELDRESRFCVDLFNQYAFNNIKFGDADILARAKNTSVQALADRGVLTAVKGQVRLLTREEIPEKVDATEECTWLLTQQLARAMEKGGVKECANIVVNLFGSNAENAKALAYRLYTICERKNWAQEGFAYNNLVVAWPDIQAMAAAIQAETPVQLTFEF